MVLFVNGLFIVSCAFFVELNGYENVKTAISPPHCTQVTKETDYQFRFKLDYPVSYIASGQSEGYQKMYCVNPAAVNKAVATVCDWSAPPQVQFTLGDEYLHVLRQDPTQRFLGIAVITTYQQCNHSIAEVSQLPNSCINEMQPTSTVQLCDKPH